MDLAALISIISIVIAISLFIYLISIKKGVKIYWYHQILLSIWAIATLVAYLSFLYWNQGVIK